MRDRSGFGIHLGSKLKSRKLSQIIFFYIFLTTKSTVSTISVDPTLRPKREGWGTRCLVALGTM
jgi:hypothetical protein